MSTITGGELLLQCLKAEGVEMIFGVLDGSFNAWLAKLDAYQMGYVCPRHEAAAAHMAEAWARVRGQPGVVIGGIGPGAANMVSGVAVAYAEGSPLIVLSGQRRRNIIYPDRGGAFQVLDLLDFYRPVTKWQAGVRDLRRLPELMRMAFRVAVSGRPGPVYIEIPEDLMRGTIDAEAVDIWSPANYRVSDLGVGDPDKIALAAEKLIAAKRPLLHAGSGVIWSGAASHFTELGEHLGAAMTTTLAARGAVPEDHRQYLHILNREALEAARGEADVVLAVGARLGELDGWGRAPVWGDPKAQAMIQVDADPTAIGLNHPVDLGIVGDARAVLAAMLQAVSAKTAARNLHVGFERYDKLTAGWRHELAQNLTYGGGEGINSGRMVQAVRGFFPRDAIAVQDGGNTSLWCANYNTIFEPRTYLYTAKFGHLGTGLPYAIGAKIAMPDRPVYLITGDGALGFNIQELETARRHNVPIIVVVAADQGWGMERSSQIFAQVGAMIETEHHPTRYDLIAQAFGCHGELVTEIDQIVPALERAQASGLPALIQVMVDKVANLAPPGALVFGSMVYRASD